MVYIIWIYYLKVYMESLVILRIILYVLCIIKVFFVFFGYGMVKYV